MKRRLVLGSGVLFCLLIGPGVVLAQGAGAGGATAAAAGASLAMTLAPLLAAATAVERVIEMVFDWLESAGRVVASFVRLGSDYLKFADQEVARYRTAVNELLQVEQRGEAFFKQLRKAESDLAVAEARLLDYFKSPDYTAKKRIASLVGGIVIGVAITLSLEMGILAMLGLKSSGVSATMDHILTGLIVGTGSAPVHSLIGILQKTRDAVDQARALWNGKAIKEIEGVLAKLQEEQGQVTPPVQQAQAPADAPISSSAGKEKPETAKEPAAVAGSGTPGTGMAAHEIRRMSRAILG